MLLSCDKQMKDSLAFTVIMASRKESIYRELKTWFKTGLFFPSEWEERQNKHETADEKRRIPESDIL